MTRSESGIDIHQRTNPPDMLERDLQKGVIELARLLGYTVAHFRPAKTAQGWRTPVEADGKGFPDLVLVRDRTVFVELKREKAKTTPEQRHWLKTLHDAGAEVYLVRPHNLDQFAAVLGARRTTTSHLTTASATEARNGLLLELEKEIAA